MRIFLAHTQARPAVKPDANMANPNFLTPYVSVYPRPTSKQVLANLMASLENRLPNALPPHEWHITVLYAVNECQTQDLRKSIVGAWEYPVTVRKADLFLNEEEETVHLVLKVQSPELTEFNSFLRKTLQLRSTFQDYVPHITLASNAHLDMDISFQDTVDAYRSAADELNEFLSEADGLPLVFWKATLSPTRTE